MSYIEIIGGKPLKGEVKIQGSKNAVLPMLAATLLNKGITIINNCPKITDVYNMLKILEDMGCIINWRENTVTVDTSNINSSVVPSKYVSELRSSIILLGALIGRMQCVTIAYPGGCSIGARPIDLHLKALKRLNVDILEGNGLIFCKTIKVTGNEISLDFPSVGATENIILASVLSEGKTNIIGGAKEPEIVELCEFLNEMGASIVGAGSDNIAITGVEKLHDIEYDVCGDRIVAGTYMAAVAASGGKVKMTGIKASVINPVIALMRDIGCEITYDKDGIIISSKGRLEAVEIIRTRPYPGFPTDMQSQIMTILAVARGTSVIIENIFEARYKAVSELTRMGAKIITDGKVAVIKGVKNLYGADVVATDLRGGAALIIAGVIANGLTIIEKPEYIKRGYEDICRDLRTLGADIHYVE